MTSCIFALTFFAMNHLASNFYIDNIIPPKSSVLRHADKLKNNSNLRMFYFLSPSILHFTSPWTIYLYIFFLSCTCMQYDHRQQCGLDKCETCHCKDFDWIYLLLYWSHLYCFGVLIANQRHIKGAWYRHPIQYNLEKVQKPWEHCSNQNYLLRQFHVHKNPYEQVQGFLNTLNCMSIFKWGRLTCFLVAHHMQTSIFPPTQNSNPKIPSSLIIPSLMWCIFEAIDSYPNYFYHTCINHLWRWPSM